MTLRRTGREDDDERRRRRLIMTMNPVRTDSIALLVFDR